MDSNRLQEQADMIIDVFGEEMLYQVISEAAKCYGDMVDYLAAHPDFLSAQEVEQIQQEVERINCGRQEN